MNAAPSTQPSTENDPAPAHLSAAQAAQARHSVRLYTDQPVTDDELTALLDATRRAPSANNAQPWRFVAVRNAALKIELMAASFNQQQVGKAPVVLVLYSDMEDVLANLGEIVHPNLSTEVQGTTIARLAKTWGDWSVEKRAVWANSQANIALGYLLLLARAQGLATSPMLGFKPELVKPLLGIPEHAQIAALVAIGHPADDGFPSHRHELDRITTYR
jgi:nitroreductase